MFPNMGLGDLKNPCTPGGLRPDCRGCGPVGRFATRMSGHPVKRPALVGCHGVTGCHIPPGSSETESHFLGCAGPSRLSSASARFGRRRRNCCSSAVPSGAPPSRARVARMASASSLLSPARSALAAAKSARRRTGSGLIRPASTPRLATSSAGCPSRLARSAARSAGGRARWAGTASQANARRRSSGASGSGDSKSPATPACPQVGHV